MGRLRTVGVVALVALVGSVVAGVASGRLRANPCEGRAPVVEANRNVRVVKRGSEIWACGKAWRHGHLLGRNGAGLTSAQYVTDIRVAGRFVAWADSLEEHENGSFYVFVADAVRGGSHGYATGSPPPPPERAGIGPATSVALVPSGAVAWIAAYRSKPGIYEVHAVSGGRRRLLASGSGIDPESLATSATTVYWTEDGSPHAARFGSGVSRRHQSPHQVQARLGDRGHYKGWIAEMTKMLVAFYGQSGGHA